MNAAGSARSTVSLHGFTLREAEEKNEQGNWGQSSGARHPTPRSWEEETDGSPGYPDHRSPSPAAFRKLHLPLGVGSGRELSVGVIREINIISNTNIILPPVSRIPPALPALLTRWTCGSTAERERSTNHKAGKPFIYVSSEKNLILFW